MPIGKFHINYERMRNINFEIIPIGFFHKILAINHEMVRNEKFQKISIGFSSKILWALMNFEYAVNFK